MSDQFKKSFYPKIYKKIEKFSGFSLEDRGDFIISHKAPTVKRIWHTLRWMTTSHPQSVRSASDLGMDNNVLLTEKIHA